MPSGITSENYEGATDRYGRLILPCECGVCVATWSYYVEALGADIQFEVEMGALYTSHHRGRQAKSLWTRLKDAANIVRGKGDVYGEGIALSRESAEKLARFLLAATDDSPTRGNPLVTHTALPATERTTP